MDLDKIKFDLLNNKDDEILEMEKLRSSVFNTEDLKEEGYYFKQVKEGNIIGVKCLYDNILIGGIYISDSYNSLFIEQLFVSSDYQRMKVGTKLLNFVLENKSIFEKYFEKKFFISRLEDRNQRNFYNKNGYNEENNLIGTMKKRI